MGIKVLSKLLQNKVPGAFRVGAVPNYYGRRIAVDASTLLYSFLTAIRKEEQCLLGPNGEETSHLKGIFGRTAKMLEFGIQPVYVFDGKAPKLKARETAKRTERKMKAYESMIQAQMAGDYLLAEKFSKRTLTVTKVHNDEAKTLLRLLGVPVVEAPTEAEAQCAALCKSGIVWATSTEDMDALTHGTPILLRNLTYSDYYRKKPIQEIYLPAVLKGLHIQMKQFVDLCILLGCDYCATIYGVGPTKALELIQTYGSIENIIENLDTSKYYIPNPFPFNEVRELFLRPKVLSQQSLEYEFIWEPPDEGGLKDFLILEHGFSEFGVNTILDRIRWFPGKVDAYTLALNRRNSSNNYYNRKKPVDHYREFDKL